MAIDEVKRRLGPPDDIAVHSNSDVEKGVTVLRYGTNGHGTFATLGEVNCANGKVSWVLPGRYLPPPSTKVISETELRDLLRRLYRPPFPKRPSDDAIWLIQAGNSLIAAGKDKALAAIQEFDQITRIRPYDGGVQGCHWLMRTIFEVPEDPGFFPCPRIGAYFIPQNRKDSPRHPIILVDDVPFSIFTGALLRGSPEPVSYDLKYFRANCRIRTTPLMPPDDPFESYQKMLKSRIWPYPPFDPKAKTSYIVPYAEEEGYALKSLLYLVRTAYRPEKMGTYEDAYINGLDFDKFHQGFLATGAHWDPVRQMYVPVDGKVLLDDMRKLPPGREQFEGSREIPTSTFDD